MHAQGTAPRPAGASGRTVAILTAVVAGLAVAFVAGPRVFAGRASGGGFASEGQLTAAFRQAFVQYWQSGARAYPPSLQRIVGYWLQYHVAKAAIAAIALAVLAVLGLQLWKAFARGGTLGAGHRAGLAGAGVAVVALAVVSLVAAMVNLRGAIVPFSSLWPMLPVGQPGGPSAAASQSPALTGTLAHIRQQLAASQQPAGTTRPDLSMMISDFGQYHLVMAVITAIVAAAFIGLGLMLWRRTRTGSFDRRTRRVLTSFAAVSLLLSLTAITVAVVNATTAADPAPKVLVFYQGSY